ncbi:MAG: hypothetical protein R6V10_15365 [bacterium]
MTEESMASGMDKEDETGNQMADEPLPDKLAALYSQSEAIKMVSLQYFLQSEKTSGMEKDGIAMKLSQMALKAIELQLRILAETARHDKPAEAPVPSQVWEVMQDLPGVGPLLRRDKIKDELVKRLKEKAREQ